MKTFSWTFPEPPLSPVERLQHIEARSAREGKYTIVAQDIKFHNKWNEIRKLGLKKYTLKQFWRNVLLFMVVALFIFILGHKEFAMNYLIGGLLGSFIGIIAGTKFNWKRNEKRFELIQALINEKFT